MEVRGKWVILGWIVKLSPLQGRKILCLTWLFPNFVNMWKRLLQWRDYLLKTIGKYKKFLESSFIKESIGSIIHDLCRWCNITNCHHYNSTESILSHIVPKCCTHVETPDSVAWLFVENNEKALDITEECRNSENQLHSSLSHHSILCFNTLYQ